MKIYFAHSQEIYHSPKEKIILKRIRKKYPKDIIINPRDFVQNSETMFECIRAIEESDLVIITPIIDYGYPFPTVHRGQGSELLRAIYLKKKIEVFYP